MRKNDDGYVLPFVLVVMIVLCIISASLMTASLRNLQIQQKFTARMVDKYEAQGEIEKAVAQLKQDLMTQNIVIERDEPGDLTPGALTPKELSEILEFDAVTQGGSPIGKENPIEVNKQFGFTVSLESPPDAATDTTIACELLVSAEYTSEQVDESPTYKYTITVDKITYESYEISTGGGT